VSQLVFDNRAPEDAVRYLEEKSVGGRFSFDWRDVWQEEHLNAFVVAKGMTADILTDIHQAMVTAVKEGQTPERFAAELTPLLQAKGWWGKQSQVDPETGEQQLVTLGTPRRLRVIYDTNMRMAHSAGRWARIMQSASTRPFLQYHHTPQEHPRPMHLAWDKITLPVTHAFWKTHWTPNGWGCKCYVTSLRKATVTSEEDLKAKGAYDQVPWRNKRTGKVELVSKGIDPGFDYNVGEARMTGLAAPAMDEPQRDYVTTPRQPAALPPAPDPRPLPADVQVRPELGADPAAAFEAMAKVVGVGEGQVYTDAAQVPLVMSQRMFEQHDAAGLSTGPKAGLASRAPLAEIFGAVLRDPDEIWHSLQARKDGSSVLVRNFLAVFDVPDSGRQWFVVTFHEGSRRGVWMGTTAYGPGKVNKLRTQAEMASKGHRVGTLVYRRK
jgi:hypothetical protein